MVAIQLHICNMKRVQKDLYHSIKIQTNDIMV